MKRDVQYNGRRLIVKAHTTDAIACIKAMKMRERFATRLSEAHARVGENESSILTDRERDLLLLALLQQAGLD